MGLKLQKEWLATLDARTRHAHGMADGQRVGLTEKFDVDGYKMMHPGDKSAPGYLVYNCRCTMITVEPDYITKGEEPRMTYAEWKAGKEAQEAQEAQKVLQNEAKSDIINSENFIQFDNGESANDFFYYDDEKRGLMAKKNSSHAKWQDGLSQDELDYIYDYTGGGYYDLNNYLRKREDWASLDAEKEEFIAQNLDSAISRYVLKDNIIVQRGVMDDALDSLIANYGYDIASFVGKEFHDDGFLSTTVVSGNRVAVIKPVLFEIKVPAGIGRGAYVNQLAGAFQDTEYEFLLRRGADYVIEDAIEDMETGKIKIKMVMKNE